MRIFSHLYIKSCHTCFADGFLVIHNECKVGLHYVFFLSCNERRQSSVYSIWVGFESVSTEALWISYFYTSMFVVICAFTMNAQLLHIDRE